MRIRKAPTKLQQIWGEEVLRPGYFCIPSTLIEYQSELGLDAIDLNILLNLLKHYWLPNRPPFPSKMAIALSMGIDESTIRKRIAKMEKKGYLTREARRMSGGKQMTNSYHLEGLRKALVPFTHQWLMNQAEKKRKRRIAEALDGQADDEKMMLMLDA